jgi:hypothetical protein
MSDAPAVPTQTPGVFVKAGDIGDFSDTCLTRLAECGYDEEDFGNHNYVADRIDQAKRKVLAYEAEAAKPAGERPAKMPPEPSPRERFLAHCTSGHLSKDGQYRQSPAKKGGAANDACLNHVPGGPRGGDTRGYHRDLAPTMPVLTGTPTSSDTLPGSPNEVMTDNENEQERRAIKKQQDANAQTGDAPRPIPLSQDQLAENARENVHLALEKGKDREPPRHRRLERAKLRCR